MRQTNLIYLAILTVGLALSTNTVRADSWADSVRKLDQSNEQFEYTCKSVGCGEQGSEIGDPISEEYGRRIITLLGAWAEGQAKRRAGLVPNEITPETWGQLREILAKVQGRWIGETTWGTQIAVGERAGLIVDLTIITDGDDEHIQKTNIGGVDCSGIGEFVGTTRGSIRFVQKTTAGECRDGEVGIRIFDDGTIKWTQFVSDWPQAWATLRKINQ